MSKKERNFENKGSEGKENQSQTNRFRKDEKKKTALVTHFTYHIRYFRVKQNKR